MDYLVLNENLIDCEDVPKEPECPTKNCTNYKTNDCGEY